MSQEKEIACNFTGDSRVMYLLGQDMESVTPVMKFGQGICWTTLKAPFYQYVSFQQQLCKFRMSNTTDALSGLKSSLYYVEPVPTQIKEPI